MSVGVRRRWRRLAARTRPVSRRGVAGRRRTGAAVALVLAALRGMQDDGWQGLQIDLAGLGDAGIGRVAEAVRALAVRHALAIVVTHDAAAIYVQRADALDLR